jgi:phosphoribosylaminoimidazole-succinocarboxamide synthase
MKKGKLLYEGKAKKVFATDDPNLLIQYFKDDATAFDGVKRGTITDKGVVNNKVSGMLFSMLEKKGIPTHFVKFLSDREMLIKKLDIVPVEVIVRNIAAGSLVKNLGVEMGRRFKQPILEFCYKSDALHDPQINRYHILALELTTKQRLDKIEEYALKRLSTAKA